MKRKSALDYQVVPFKIAAGEEPRHLVMNKSSLEPSLSASLYETHLHYHSRSYKTVRKKLTSLAFLYTWFKRVGENIDKVLLSGNGLKDTQVRAFVSWLKAQFTDNDYKMSNATRGYINGIIYECSTAVCWFIEHCYDRTGAGSGRWALEFEALERHQRKIWARKRYKIKAVKEAPDLTDEEIAAVETFLKSSISTSKNKDLAVRDYLIWRIVIEFGLRIGEVLALRLQDRPTRDYPYFSIVRIDERGADYHDPRPSPPRPKTLSRELGFLFKNTVFPRLINDYVSDNRYVWAERNGKRFKKFALLHDFLIIANNGAPLSESSASDISRKISKELGIDFHWHLARHAFFNRAYYAATEATTDTSLEIKLDDLVWWGGWQDEKSLDHYSARVRADRARYALSMFQKNNRNWGALS
jgi:integrase